MNSTMKAVSALAIATAALAATAVPGRAVHFGQASLFNGGGFHAQPRLWPAWGKFRGNVNRNLPPALNFAHGPVRCFTCNLPRPDAVNPRPVHWDQGWNHWHGWHYRPEVYVEGRPETTGATGAAPSLPVLAPAATPPPAASPRNCLTKQDLPNGGVLFQDICTKERAVGPPPPVGAR